MIELVSATTDGSTGIAGSKASLLIIISEHSVETWKALNIMGAVVKKPQPTLSTPFESEAFVFQRLLN